MGRVNKSFDDGLERPNARFPSTNPLNSAPPLVIVDPRLRKAYSRCVVEVARGLLPLKILFESAIRFGEGFRRRHNLYDISFVRFLADYVMRNTGKDSNILVVGGGEVARGVVRELLRGGYRSITVINRTTDKLKYKLPTGWES